MHQRDYARTIKIRSFKKNSTCRRQDHVKIGHRFSKLEASFNCPCENSPCECPIRRIDKGEPYERK